MQQTFKSSILFLVGLVLLFEDGDEMFARFVFDGLHAQLDDLLVELLLVDLLFGVFVLFGQVGIHFLYDFEGCFLELDGHDDLFVWQHRVYGLFEHSVHQILSMFVEETH